MLYYYIYYYVVSGVGAFVFARRGFRKGFHMVIRESAEDYLEAMLMLKQERGYIRSIDVAQKIGVTKPSVSYATRRLRENGYLTMDTDGLITLTDKGEEIAERMLTRHRSLTTLLVRLGVDPEIAQADACRMEHVLSQESFDAICRHVDDIDN